MIPSITIDSTNGETDLCRMGRIYGTDKTPLNPNGHRHPYTAVYSLLFGRYRYSKCKFAEIGIYWGSSVLMWNHYFKDAMFYFFDSNEKYLSDSTKFVSKDNNNFCFMDVTDPSSIVNSLTSTGGDLDILLDDSTHRFEDHITIIKRGLPYIKSGGMIVIEDLFRNGSESEYYDNLKDVLDEFSEVFFIVTDHKNRYSFGCDNDKLLVLIKK